jgi:hypothetical protein
VLVCPTDRPGRVFEVRLTGEVSRDDVEAALEHVDLVGHEATTVVRCPSASQSALFRVLRVARTYGLEIVEIRQITRTGPAGRVEERR